MAIDEEKKVQGTDDYYNALKNESYKAMLNSEIQASVARDQAMKYTQNSMNATGYGTQGLAQSTNLGIQNAYQSALKNAAETHQANLLGLNQQQRQEELANQDKITMQNNQEFESLATLMNSASNLDQLNTILGNYGVSVGDNGFTYDASKSSFLTDSDKRQLETIYSLYKENFGNSNVYSNANDLSSMTYLSGGENNGKVQSVGDNFSEEINLLFYQSSVGKVENGGVVKVTNYDGDTIYLKWNGNGYVRSSASEYNDSDYQYEINGESKRKGTSSFKTIKG